VRENSRRMRVHRQHNEHGGHDWSNWPASREQSRFFRVSRAMGGQAYALCIMQIGTNPYEFSATTWYVQWCFKGKAKREEEDWRNMPSTMPETNDETSCKLNPHQRNSSLLITGTMKNHRSRGSRRRRSRGRILPAIKANRRGLFRRESPTKEQAWIHSVCSEINLIKSRANLEELPN
jgi:hypothetical protein